MKLLELIPYLRDPAALLAFYQRHGLDPDGDVLSIYMEGGLRVDADIRVLGMNEVGDDIRVVHEGVAYEHLLPVDLAADLLATDRTLQGPFVTDTARAERVVEYGIYDA